MTILRRWLNNRLVYRFHHLETSAQAMLTGKPAIRTLWAIKDLNAGDLVTPMLLAHYGFIPVWSYRDQAELVSCGSLLDRIPDDFKGFILGTGLMHGDVRKTLPKARILAVRGELTRERIDAPKETVLGDPGLLMVNYLKKRSEKRYHLGLVPHFTDKKDTRLGQLLQSHGKDVLMVDIQANPLKVLSQMDQCETILSSSLHGMIFADALGIPSAWTILGGKVQGEGFKFYDYRSALNLKSDPISITGMETPAEIASKATLPEAAVVEDVKSRLVGAYQVLKQEFLQRNSR